MELLDRSQLLQQAVVRLIAATPDLTYFGPDAVSTAIADAIAAGAASPSRHGVRHPPARRRRGGAAASSSSAGS